MCRVSVLLLRLHHTQLVATPGARHVLVKLQRRLRTAMQGLKDTLGVNLAGVRFLQRMLKERNGVADADAVLPAKRMLEKAA